MDILIRKATVSDASDIATLLHRAFKEYKPMYTPGGYASTVPCAREIADRLDDVETLVAEYGNVCIATVGIQRTGKGIYIQSMAVDPDYRGQGAAKRMLEYIETLARDSGMRRLYLCTTPFLHGAISLYESTGFVRIQGSEHDLHGTPLFDMEKFLMKNEK